MMLSEKLFWFARHNDVRTRTSFRSTSRDRQTAVRRPRSINFAPFNAQFISDVLATLFIWSKAECGSLCSWSYRWDMEKSWPEFLCLRESVFQQKRSSYRACGLWEVSLTFRHNPTLLTFYTSHVKLLIQILSKLRPTKVVTFFLAHPVSSSGSLTTGSLAGRYLVFQA